MPSPFASAAGCDPPMSNAEQDMSVDTGSDVEMEHADVEAAGSADVPATVQPAPSAQHPAQATAASAFLAYGAPLGALPPAEAVLLANQPVLVFVAGPLAHELLQVRRCALCRA